MTASLIFKSIYVLCGSIAGVFGSITNALIEVRTFDNKAFKELHRMSDRELKDIGLCRGDIRAVSSGQTPFRGSV